VSVRDDRFEVPEATGHAGESVVQRRYVSHHEAHYGGGLVNGAYIVALFGDVATELCIRTDGDEGLFASYKDIQFLAPVLAGDMIEAEGIVVEIGRRSRRMRFEARVVSRSTARHGPSTAQLLEPPLVVATAEGTVVIPAQVPDGPPHRLEADR
jgi:3-aminobutyryl-CoA ammonia-lyase